MRYGTGDRSGAAPLEVVTESGASARSDPGYLQVDVVALRLKDVEHRLVNLAKRLLTGPELARANSFERDEDRRQSMAGSLLVRAVVARALRLQPSDAMITRCCPSCGGPHGAPFADGAPLMSVSHSKGIVAVGTCLRPIGLDIEPADRVMTDRSGGAGVVNEGWVSSAEVLRTWVRKEAVLKATGLGVTVALSTVQVSRPDQRPFVVRYGPDPGMQISLDDLPWPGVAGAVAVLTDRPIHTRVEDGSALISSLQRK